LKKTLDKIALIVYNLYAYPKTAGYGKSESFPAEEGQI
jgi:hypothetical protein